MWYCFSNYGNLSWLWLLIIFILFLIFIVNIFSFKKNEDDDLTKLLKEKLAKGEITIDEYNKKMEILNK